MSYRNTDIDGYFCIAVLNTRENTGTLGIAVRVTTDLQLIFYKLLQYQRIRHAKLVKLEQ